MNDTQQTSGPLHGTPVVPSAAIRLLVMSDAIPERNGVGSYYADLIQQISPRVELAELIYPMCEKTADHSYLTTSLPGDKTQALQLPKPAHLISLVKGLNPNVIIAPTPGPYGMAGLFLARRYKIPLVTGFHTHYEALTELYWKRIGGTLARGFLKSCNRLMFRYSDIVLANSPDMCSQARKAGANNVRLMGTSVASDFVTTPVVPTQPTIQSILFAGRLAKEKNIHAVLEAAKVHRGMQFTIAGDGPLMAEINEACKCLPNVTMTGWVQRDRLMDLIDSHDALLLPSHVESFGTVALEGMARARIVIVSQHCGLTEWRGLNDAVVKISDKETAASALHRINEASPEWRRNIENKAAHAARHINEWNTRFWIDLLAERVSGCSHTIATNSPTVSVSTAS